MDSIYSSLSVRYLTNNRREYANQILELESQFKEWKVETVNIINQYNLSKAFNDYDSQLQEKINIDVKKYGNFKKKEEKELKMDIRAIMSESKINCIDLVITESGCLWVYTIDNGQNKDQLAQMLCFTAKNYSVKCITVFDPKQNELGRHLCD